MDIQETKIDFSNLPEDVQNAKYDEATITEILEHYDISELVKMPMLAKYVKHRTEELEEKLKKDIEAIEKYEYAVKQARSTPEERKQNAKDRLKKKLEARKK